MPAELGAHGRGGELPGLKGEGGCGEGLRHLLPLEEAEIAALGGAGPARALPRERREIRPALQSGDGLTRFRLGLHQDVARPYLGLLRLAHDVLLVACPERLFGQKRADLAREEGLLQRLLLGPADPSAHLRRVLQVELAGGVHKHALGNELVEHDRVKNLRRHGTELLRQAAYGFLELGEMDRRAVDPGDDRVGGWRERLHLRNRCRRGEEQRRREERRAGGEAGHLGSFTRPGAGMLPGRG